METFRANSLPYVPLSRFSLVDTRDPGAAQAEIGRIFCSHRLTPLKRGAPHFHAVHNSARQDGFSVNFVAYGADVEIDPGCLDRFFLLQIPLSGSARVRCGVSNVEASPDVATLLSPTLPTLMRWREGTAKLIVLIERGVVETHLAQLLDRTVGSVEFAPAVRLDGPAGAALRSQALLIQALADRHCVQKPLRDALVGQMLAALPHNHSQRLTRAAAPPAPAHVKRAEAYIAEHARLDFSVTDVADFVGVSLRTLQSGFRRFRATTLSEAVLGSRLELWRRAISDPENPKGVVDLAGEAGLAHAGRAASAIVAAMARLRRRRAGGWARGPVPAAQISADRFGSAPTRSAASFAFSLPCSVFPQ